MDKQRELNLPKRNTVLNSDLIANVRNCIVLIRDTPVISDADVAALYGVETKRVNEAVRNNPDKFPQDYNFEEQGCGQCIFCNNRDFHSGQEPKA